MRCRSFLALSDSSKLDGHYPGTDSRCQALIRLIARAGAFIADAERFHPAIKMRAVNADSFRRARNVAVAFGKLAKDVIPLICFAAFAVRCEIISGRSGYGFGSPWRRQILCRYAIIYGHDYHSLDCIAQFTHVSGPIIRGEAIERGVCKQFWRSIVPG